jgi:hypothetical protein
MSWVITTVRISCPYADAYALYTWKWTSPCETTWNMGPMSGTAFAVFSGEAVADARL